MYENCAAHTFSVQRIVRLMTKWFSSLYAGDKSYSIFQMINLFTFHFLCALPLPLPYPAIFISFTHSCHFGESAIAIHISLCVPVCAELVRRRQSPFRWIQWHARWSKETAKPANAFAWFSTYRLTEHTTAAAAKKKYEKIVKMSQCVFTASFARAICHDKNCVWVWQNVGTQKERCRKRETYTNRQRSKLLM